MVPRIAMMKALQQHSRERHPHRAGSAPKPTGPFGDALVLSVASPSFSKEIFLMPGQRANQ